MSGFVSKLQNMDFYRRIPRELTESSTHSSLLSLCAGLFLAVLFMVEVSDFLTVETETQIVMEGVDGGVPGARESDNNQLRINFNITLMDLDCDYASIDVWDVLGTRKVNISTHINRWRLDEKGVRAVFHGRNKEQDDILHETHHLSLEQLHQNGVHATPLDSNSLAEFQDRHDYTFVNFYAPWCIWCQRLAPIWEAFAESVEGDPGVTVAVGSVDCVANSHLCMEQRIQAFPTLRLFKGRSPAAPDYHDHRTVEALQNFIREQTGQVPGQKKEDKAVKGQVADAEGKKEHPGCQLSGFVLVNPVPGNFHVEARSKHHNLNAAMTNLSHIVHHLSFGPPVSEKLLKRLNTVPEAYQHTHSMNGQAYITHKYHEAYHHYIKVVGTSYHIGRTYRGDNALHAYQMVQQSQIMPYMDQDVPEARFSYDISPMRVRVRRKGKRWYDFITSMCAIIGGTFTVVGLISGLLGTVFKSKKL